MKRLVLIIFPVFICLYLSSCVDYSTGNKAIMKKRLVNKIKPHESTKHNIVRLFGHTNGVKHIKDREEWTYSYFLRKRYWFFFDDKIEDYHLQVFFDKSNDKVLEYDFYDGDGVNAPDSNYLKNDPRHPMGSQPHHSGESGYHHPSGERSYHPGYSRGSGSRSHHPQVDHRQHPNYLIENNPHYRNNRY